MIIIYIQQQNITEIAEIISLYEYYIIYRISNDLLKYHIFIGLTVMFQEGFLKANVSYKY